MDELILKLWLTPGLGAAKVGALLEHFSSLHQFQNATASQLQTAGLSQKQLDYINGKAIEQTYESHLEWNNGDGNHLLFIGQDAYPAPLRDIPRPPVVLCVRGNVTALKDPQIGIVGSRNPTSSGKETAKQFAKHLGDTGITVTSGLADGIDAQAHQGALQTSTPTIAVVGTGIDRVYPAKHKPLAQQILDHGGTIVSEYPLGAGAQPSHFPQRNRIISGMSLGVLVVEAAVKSGSLITAHHAKEQGKEVFAMPGSIHNPLAKGCHQLIKQGAKLVETAEDILIEIAPQLEAAIQPPEPKDTTHSESAEHNGQFEPILQAMEYDIVSLDSLSERLNMPSHELASTLLIMELNGLVTSESGGRYLRK